MKILFSPSETKYKDGLNKKIDKSSFIFPELYEYRIEVIEKYQEYINSESDENVLKLFGVKKSDLLEYYKGNLLDKKIMKVIERYDGVAFDYLKYSSLDNSSQKYIDENIIIFSNLFGPLKAGDIGIPDYKLKQGQKIGDFTVEKFYNKFFTKALDEYLAEEEIIDLRAGFYEKFYKLKKPYWTMKFMKNNKVVSHWSKAYRGMLLRTMAEHDIQTADQLLNLKIENLSIEKINKSKLKSEIVYNIEES
ncbi:UPF0246 protein YaaA [hydrothermal vent metagenome]|uniref:UPF0246 protein YaaA n=1 Tax=hydrothermal vent metagenome TaxID=652676 RepID=A0A1W1EEG4_9ZZZZ